MKRRVGFLCLVAACSVTPVIAQGISVSFQLTWAEVDAASHAPVANPNGVLEPGEAARLITSVSFSPPVGTVFPNGGVVAGFADTLLRIDMSRVGAWSGFQVPAGFWQAPFGPPTTTWIMREVGQPVPLPGGFPIAANPIPELLSIVWTPSQYSGPSVQAALFEFIDVYPRILVRYDTGPQSPWYEAVESSSQNWSSMITIPVVPAPSVGVVVAGGVIVGCRRRRRGLTSLTGRW